MQSNCNLSNNTEENRNWYNHFGKLFGRKTKAGHIHIPYDPEFLLLDIYPINYVYMFTKRHV